ncbi:MAG: glycoside hydrolase family 3 N-terminal domain-containing protein [Acutalibacteraceae bacterium]
MNEKKLTELLNSLTLKQKIGQLFQCCGSVFDDSGVLTGKPFLDWLNEEITDNCGSILNIYNNKSMRNLQKKHLEKNPVPLMVMCDIINGCELIFPSSIAQGCSFNPNLAQRACEITASESAKHGINVTFSPMVDVSRDARWGRISEGYGESTLLNCDFAAANVKGYQGDSLLSDDTIASCVKHFAAYGVPCDGKDYNSVEVSERLLRTTYLPPYKAALDAGARMIMPSFNTINGVPSTVNPFLLKKVLRGEWGFDGVVISDFFAVKGSYEEGSCNSKEECAALCIENGVDIDMSDDIYTNHLEKALQEGMLNIEDIDAAVMRVLKLKNDLGLFEDPYKYIKVDDEDLHIDIKQHKEFTLDMISQSSVLLKNDGILPLKTDEKVSFIGPFIDATDLFTTWSAIMPHAKKGNSVKQVLKSRFGDKYKALKGAPYLYKEEQTDSIEDEVIGNEKKYLEQAVNSAKSVDKVVLFIGEHRSLFGEAHSKTNIKLPKAHIDLFNEIYKVNKNIVVVLFNGRPLDLSEINDRADAILDVWYPGTFGAEAIIDMLFGDRIPSGKLAMTFPQNIGQVPIHHEMLRTNHYHKVGGIEAGYCTRYIDCTNLPLYPFGYGLSYTEFVYSQPKVSKNKMMRDEIITVSVEVKNIGNVDAYETVQLYIHDLNAKYLSLPKILKSYKKVFIKAGEKVDVSFEINEEMLKYYDINNNFISENGIFRVFVSKDSDTENFVDFELI